MLFLYLSRANIIDYHRKILLNCRFCHAINNGNGCLKNFMPFAWAKILHNSTYLNPPPPFTVGALPPACSSVYTLTRHTMLFHSHRIGRFRNCNQARISDTVVRASCKLKRACARAHSGDFILWKYKVKNDKYYISFNKYCTSARARARLRFTFISRRLRELVVGLCGAIAPRSPSGGLINLKFYTRANYCGSSRGSCIGQMHFVHECLLSIFQMVLFGANHCRCHWQYLFDVTLHFQKIDLALHSCEEKNDIQVGARRFHSDLMRCLPDKISHNYRISCGAWVWTHIGLLLFFPVSQFRFSFPTAQAPLSRTCKISVQSSISIYYM